MTVEGRGKGKGKTKGQLEAEAALLEMASQGLQSELALHRTSAPDYEVEPEPEAPRAEPKRHEAKVKMEPQKEKKDYPFTAKIRKSTWLEMKDLQLSYQRAGNKVTQDTLADTGLSSIIAQMRRGLAGDKAPDPADLATEAAELLRGMIRAGEVSPENLAQAETLVDRIDSL